MRTASLGLLLAAVALAGPSLAAPKQDARKPAASWEMLGGDLHNTRNAASETIIGVDNVAQLQPGWSIDLKGAIQANVVSDGVSLFVPTTTGALYRIEAKTGKIVWEKALDETLGVPGASTRALGLSDRAVIFGIRKGLAAVSRETGDLLWKVDIDDHPTMAVTQPPVIWQNRVFIGTAGAGEEAAAVQAGYQCCGFRGSMMAFDADTGKQLWKMFSVPEGFAGGAFWSRGPMIDPKRGTLFLTTGNLFSAPDDVEACAHRNQDKREALAKCYPPNVWYDSIIAVDAATGRIKWGFRAEDYDIFTGACQVPEKGAPENCGGGGDFDFGNGAILWQTPAGRELVGAGQKSGDFWALDPDTGALVWHQKLGPGGPNGGIQAGSAADGRLVYTSQANSSQVNHAPRAYRLPDGRMTRAGSFAALDAETGRIVWQVEDPAVDKYAPNEKCRRTEVQESRDDCGRAVPGGPVTVANGVVFGCTRSPDGTLYAFEAATGRLLWRYDTGSACTNGAVILDGTIYWGNARTLRSFKVAPPADGRKRTS